jgi:catechol 2,3-dioxygenase-like lactoylglutathione lyase family enzyme
MNAERPSPGQPRVSGLDHVQIMIRAGGEDAVRRFYGELLGMREVPKPAALADRGGCWLVGEGVALHFGVEKPFRRWRRAHVALLVDDLAGLRARLEAAGTPTRPGEAIGVRRFYVKDPFGNRLELVDRRDGGFTDRDAGSTAAG